MKTSLYKVVRTLIVLSWIGFICYILFIFYNYSTKNFYANLFKVNSEYIATSFDFPVGINDIKAYYIAQKFKENEHLGDDWNAVTGGNTDLGHPIYSVANGYVSKCKDYGGSWGKVVRVIHYYDGQFYESLYAHCQDILVEKGAFVSINQQIATIGNSDGIYLAHLHLELRNKINLPLGYGYSQNTKGYLDPDQFIKANRDNMIYN